MKRNVVRQDNFYGFCTHSSIIFLTWHRPYLALFEVSKPDDRMRGLIE